ncbi:DUF3509 domain-containing protein [Pseudomonas aeruginosa]|nr:DUF3509 domain-containing protein [Pseudomonas aeruginosa]
MEKSIKMLFDAFQATFAVSTQMRPDGGALLTLRNGEEIVTRRVVSAAQLADEKRMYWFINAVRLTWPWRQEPAGGCGRYPASFAGARPAELHGGLNGSSGILAEASGRAGESARVKLRGLGEDRPAPLVSEGRPGLACPFGASAGWRRTMQGRSGQHQG